MISLKIWSRLGLVENFHLLFQPVGFCVIINSMRLSISDNKKSRGRPVTTGTSPLIGVRLPSDVLAALDKAIADDAAEHPPAFTRPGLIRVIVEHWLIEQEYLPEKDGQS